MTSTVGLYFPREKAKIRGANRRGLVSIERDPSGEANLIVIMVGHSVNDIRFRRKLAKGEGAWQDRYRKRPKDWASMK